MADEIEVEELLAEAWALFDADQAAAAAPLQKAEAERLAEKFEFANIALAPGSDGGLSWVAAHGHIGNVEIRAARGGLTELMVQVNGTSAQARNTLAEMWRHLAHKNDKPLDANAVIYDRTTAIVRLPVDPTDVFPVARVLADRAVAASKKQSLRLMVEPLIKFTVEINMTTGTRGVIRNVMFEPRTIARPGKRVFFTQSPLASDEHLDMVREVVALVKARGQTTPSEPA